MARKIDKVVCVMTTVSSCNGCFEINIGRGRAFAGNMELFRAKRTWSSEMGHRVLIAIQNGVNSGEKKGIGDYNTRHSSSTGSPSAAAYFLIIVR